MESRDTTDAITAEQTVLLFSYGTLRQVEVQLTTFGRLLHGEADSIPGYAIDFIDISDPHVVATSGSARHPIVRSTGIASDRVEGTVFAISQAELEAADEYEVDDYVRVSVTLTSGRQAWTYVQAEVPSPQ